MRETPVKSAVAVSPSAFSQRHSLGVAGYLFILIRYAAHADADSLALQKGRDRSVCSDINVLCLDVTINNLHGVFTTLSQLSVLGSKHPDLTSPPDPQGFKVHSQSTDKVLI